MVGCQVLDNGAKVLLPDRHPRVKAMRRLHVQGNVGWIQQHTLVYLNFREDRVAISEAKGIELRMLANKVSEIVYRDRLLCISQTKS